MEKINTQLQKDELEKLRLIISRRANCDMGSLCHRTKGLITPLKNSGPFIHSVEMSKRFHAMRDTKFLKLNMRRKRPWKVSNGCCITKRFGLSPSSASAMPYKKLYAYARAGSARTSYRGVLRQLKTIFFARVCGTCARHSHTLTPDVQSRLHLIVNLTFIHFA